MIVRDCSCWQQSGGPEGQEIYGCHSGRRACTFPRSQAGKAEVNHFRHFVCRDIVQLEKLGQLGRM